MQVHYLLCIVRIEYYKEFSCIFFFFFYVNSAVVITKKQYINHHEGISSIQYTNQQEIFKYACIIENSNSKSQKSR